MRSPPCGSDGHRDRGARVDGRRHGAGAGWDAEREVFGHGPPVLGIMSWKSRVSPSASPCQRTSPSPRVRRREVACPVTATEGQVGGVALVPDPDDSAGCRERDRFAVFQRVRAGDHEPELEPLLPPAHHRLRVGRQEPGQHASGRTPCAPRWSVPCLRAR